MTRACSLNEFWVPNTRGTAFLGAVTFVPSVRIPELLYRLRLKAKGCRLEHHDFMIYDPRGFLNEALKLGSWIYSSLLPAA